LINYGSTTFSGKEPWGVNGWMGQILVVNLTTAEITHFSTQAYNQKYLGGRGIACRIYWEMVSARSKAFDPENCLIFVVGPLVATGAQGATRMSVAGKSPKNSATATLADYFRPNLRRRVGTAWSSPGELSNPSTCG
jgi:aldehyde:ferredoxin oxidoreductase